MIVNDGTSESRKDLHWSEVVVFGNPPAIFVHRYHPLATERTIVGTIVCAVGFDDFLHTSLESTWAQSCRMHGHMLTTTCSKKVAQSLLNCIQKVLVSEGH